MAKFYILKRGWHPWGDYGDILLHGMSCHLDREAGLIQLERTGPFVPPISFPGISDIVVTDELRREIETSGLGGCRFQPVIKKLIVHSNWHSWDKEADSPSRYPQGGEPENYILGKPHSARAAVEIGDLWELLLNATAKVRRAKGTPPRDDEIFIQRESWRGEDLFRAQGVGYNYVSERAKKWLEERVAEYVAFQEAKTEGRV